MMALLLTMLTGCRPPKTDWSVSLNKDLKAPYGSWIAFNSLQNAFPDARVEVLSPGFRYTSFAREQGTDSSNPTLLILVGLDFEISENEWNRLLDFAKEGNEILLFSRALDPQIEGRLGFTLSRTDDEERRPLARNELLLNQNALYVRHVPGKSFGHRGRNLRNFFDIDTATLRAEAASVYQRRRQSDTPGATANALELEGPTEVLGWTRQGPDFIRYPLGQGHLSIHTAPLVLSNYFLLQPGNEAYLEAVWASMPRQVSTIFWNSYFKRSAEEVSMKALWNHPASRWALLLGIATLLTYVLFESKRRQRIIPVVRPPENTSVGFAETIGRLYYNKANHQNLAEKIVQHFLEHLRLRYQLNTELLDESLARALAARSNQPLSLAQAAIRHAAGIRNGTTAVNETYLHDLYRALKPFSD
jgi:hypothetical protein